jgi:hypothetical protein
MDSSGEEKTTSALVRADSSPPAEVLQSMGLLPKVQLTRMQRVKGWLLVSGHRMQNTLMQTPLWERLLHTLVWSALPVLGAIQVGWGTATKVALAFLILSRIAKGYRDSAPRHMQPLHQGYIERKLLLYRLISDAPRIATMDSSAIDRFRCEALDLIANYVRNHRRDMKGIEVFVNLLVLEGDEILVIARDKEHRVGKARYPKAWMVAAKAIETGHEQLIGDLRVERPETPSDKRYRSLMIIPVFFGGVVVGAVSIDSSRPYDFHADFSNLNKYLKPYVGLLAWTLDPALATSTALEGHLEGGTR